MSSISSRKKSIFNPLENEKNDFWVKDEQRFGVKMLKAMGWSPGKGLGINENGSADAVKVRLKNDIKGVGYKERDDQWIAHQDDFNALLSSLNGGRTFTDEEFKPQNLEAKSKRSRHRMHYHKLARWKDLSSRSERDIASILGKRAHKADNVEEFIETQNESTVNMREYFSMKKMEIEKRNESMVRSVADPDSPQKRPISKKMKLKKVTFGDVNVADAEVDGNHFQDHVSSKSGEEIAPLVDEVATTRKKKRRKKQHCEDISEIHDDQVSEHSKPDNGGDCEGFEELPQTKPKKTRRRKKTNDNKELKNGETKETSVTGEDPVGPTKKKKRNKRKKHDKRCHDEMNENGVTEGKRKKRKSIKSKSGGDVEDETINREVSISRLIESLKTISMFENLQNNVAKSGCS